MDLEPSAKGVAVRFLAAFLLSVTASLASTLHVPADYVTIQAAIDAAVDGDTVLISAGDYCEFLTITDKSISLIGEVIGSVRVYQTVRSDDLLAISGGSAQPVYIQAMVFETGSSVIYCHISPLTLKDCTIRDGSNSLGAGILCVGSPDLTITGCVIEYNEADEAGPYGGGGMYLSNIGNVTITNSRIEHNIANDVMAGGDRDYASGGGIYATDIGALSIANSVICSNWTYGYGSGMHCEAQTLSLHNCVFAANQAYISPTALKAWVYDYGDVRNCIFYNNLPSMAHQIGLPVGSAFDIAYCNIQDSTASVEGSYTWGPGNIDEDPQFITGFLSEFHLAPGSPCIDAGDPDPSFNDPEDPANPGYALWPALGLLRNDMGAYGGGGAAYWLGIAEEPAPPFQEVSLDVFPNPFSTIAAVVFQLPESGRVELRVFDIIGRLVDILADGDFSSGTHSLIMSAAGLPAGMYIVRLESSGSSTNRRVILLR
jgi:hypothetical protein